MAAATIQLSQIGQIALNVKDLQRAVAFYRDTLGMKFLFEAGNMAFFDCGGLRLLLGQPRTPEEAHGASILYYKVEDIRPAFDALRARGVEPVEEPQLVARLPNHDLWLGFLRDSEGNVFALMSEMRRA